MKPEAEEAGQVLSALDNAKKKIEGRLDVAREIIRKKAGEVKPEAEDKRVLHKRLLFEKLGVRFFVDFTIAPKTGSEEAVLEGHIIYGAVRQIAEELDRQDKPLFVCNVSEHGLIKDPGGIKGSWWLGAPGDEKESDASSFGELHERIVANIWKDALRWANKYPTTDKS